jgi:hypothetical protein
MIFARLYDTSSPNQSLTIFAGLSLLASACRVTLTPVMLSVADPASPISSVTTAAAAKQKDHCTAAIFAFQLHARSVVSDCLLRFYAFVCREHPVGQEALQRAIASAAVPDIDDFDAFAAWSGRQENCGVAVACAVAHMLRLLQAAGDCPGLRETLKAASESERAVPGPLQTLLDGVRCDAPGN